MTNPEVTSLLTLAETSGFRRTGRIDEVERLCAAFSRQWPEAVRAFEYGRSAQGRPLMALVVSRAGSLDPAELRRRGVPLLMLQGGIHPGESDGKDAGFIALRELLSGDVARGVLERVALLFVPAFNTDGHDRMGRANRPNQNGPEETGWRATAHNLNLNRDYMKADAPEMQAMLRLLQEWEPLVCADLHVTDGADFEPDISLQVEPINQGDPRLRPSGTQLRDALIGKLAAQGSLPLPFYPDLARTDDPASGFVLTVYSPRFSTGYFPQRNRFTVLVETHSWKDYATRVRVTRNTIVGLVELVGVHGEQWLREAGEADSTAAQLGGVEMTLDYRSSWREPAKGGQAASDVDDAGARIIEFRGYAYTRSLSPISGSLMTVYDPKTPQIWRVPFRDRVEASLVVRAPRGGYLVPAEHAEMVGAKLALHGIAFEPLRRPLENAQVEQFRIIRAQFSSEPFEGRQRVALDGEWGATQRDVPAGVLFVPIAQPRSRLVVALLEPQAPDSLAAWGFFNACFEQKEQIEPYVAEQIAKDMFDSDPGLRAEFARSLKDDPAFAADPGARLDFFCRRHASYDEKRHLYPILRRDSTL
ncbi:MAG: peptidase M14 [Vicinamibacteria bacterium]|nr:peptidase M14 [Vicinamibacteria bacterium]